MQHVDMKTESKNFKLILNILLDSCLNLRVVHMWSQKGGHLNNPLFEKNIYIS